MNLKQIFNMRRFTRISSDIKYLSKLDVFRFAAQSLFKSYPKIDVAPTIKKRTIIFHPVVNPDYITFIYELILARQFIILGQNVLFIINDGILTHTEHSQKSLSKYSSYSYYSWNKIKRLTLFVIVYLLGKGKIKPVFLSQLHMSSKDISIDEIDHKIVLKYAKESTIRYSESELIDFTSQFYFDSVFNATTMLRVAKYLTFNVSNPLFVSWHNIYSCYGPLYQTFVNNGIPCRTISWTVGKLQSLRIYRSIPTYTLDDSMWLKQKLRPLLEREKSRAANYLNSRINLTTYDMKNMYIDSPDRISVCSFERFLNQNPNPLVFMPNVVWDSPTDNRNVLFDSLTDAILFVTRFCLDNSIPIVLRFHPAEEVLLPKRRSLADDIIPALGNMEGHPMLHIVNSSQHINIYNYFDRIGAGLVYDGTSAYEMVYHGIPVIGLGEARNCQKEWAMIPRTIEELKKLLIDKPYRDEKFYFDHDTRKEYVLRHINWALFSSAVEGPWMNTEEWPPTLQNFWPNFNRDQFIKFAYLNGLSDLDESFISSNF